MAASFFFYDLETSGFDSRRGRIMQFAGIRTDMNLQPVGEPVNLLIKLTPDVIPSPDAIMVTGITPQQTLADGLTEAEFMKLFYQDVVQPNTIFMGFNSIRFDDEFMRFLHWRNFYDAYEWQWRDGCSRWDLLDVVRMTRALRPDGIEWPFAPDGKPTNRLEYLTSVNKLSHEQAHDALSDVYATIAVAKLIKDKQPKLFAHLLSVRGKKQVAPIIMAGQHFVYTSGRYPSAILHTSAAVYLADNQQGALVYDLRHDPTPFLDMSVIELVKHWRYTKEPDALRLPVKSIKYNHCPAVAPLGVMKDQSTQERIDLSLKTVAKHLAIFNTQKAAFANKVLQAVSVLDTERQQAQTALIDNQLTVDCRLYDGFVAEGDRNVMRALRAAQGDDLNDIGSSLTDDRLVSLLPLYKARNYPKILTDEERAEWEIFCQRQIFDGGSDSQLAKFFARLTELAKDAKTGEKQFLIEELQLYGQSIIPADVAE